MRGLIRVGRLGAWLGRFGWRGRCCLPYGVVGLLGAGCCEPPKEAVVSDHFDGRRFHNIERADHSLGRFFKWTSSRTPGRWRDWVDAEPGPAPPERVGRGDLRVTFVNHATVLIQMDGLNILTDPIWSERCSPVSWAGPRRRRPPGIRFEDLPPIDVVLISHDHYDHMDVPTLKRLGREHRPRFFAGLGNAAFLGRAGIDNAEDMDWWQSTPLSRTVGLHCVPARHWSGRELGDRNRTLWCGFVIEGPAGVVYFAGDTGFGPHFGQIRERFGRPRLALLPIGAFKPRWFMGPFHLCPAEAVRAHGVLGAGTSVGIHFGTFPLADDDEDEPVALLKQALEGAGESGGVFLVLGFGEGLGVGQENR